MPTANRRKIGNYTCVICCPSAPRSPTNAPSSCATETNNRIGSDGEISVFGSRFACLSLFDTQFVCLPEFNTVNYEFFVSGVSFYFSPFLFFSCSSSREQTILPLPYHLLLFIYPAVSLLTVTASSRRAQPTKHACVCRRWCLATLHAVRMRGHGDGREQTRERTARPQRRCCPDLPCFGLAKLIDA